MTIEESSVVAAASKAAKFWMNHGGFKAEVLEDEKIGQVYLFFHGKKKLIQEYFDFIKPLGMTFEQTVLFQSNAILKLFCFSTMRS